MKASFVFFILSFFLIPQNLAYAETYTFVQKWGTKGTADGQFNCPARIARDTQGYLYIVDSENNNVQKFSSSGEFVLKWGSAGSQNGQFNYPVGISVDKFNYIYIADYANFRIQKFTSDGQFIMAFGTLGTGDGQFVYPVDIAIGSSGNIYVADQYNNRMQKFDSNGNFITKWGDGNTFYFPAGIAVDSNENVYVTDDHHHVQKFTSDGSPITSWGTHGAGDGQFSWPEGIAVDSFGNVYVADTTNYRVQVFNSNGEFLSKFGTMGTGDGQFRAPKGIVFEGDGSIFILDQINFVQTFIETKSTISLNNGVPLYNLSGATGSDQYYKITIPEDCRLLTIQTQSGSGDCDIFVNPTSAPTTTKYFSYSVSDSTEEEIKIDNPQAGDWYIRLSGFSSFTGVSLLASYTVSNAAAPDVLQINSLYPDQYGFRGDVKQYVLPVTQQMKSLDVKTVGGVGDCYLLIYYQDPTKENFDYCSLKKGSEQSIHIDNPAVGNYYVMLYAKTNYLDVTLATSPLNRAIVPDMMYLLMQ